MKTALTILAGLLCGVLVAAAVLAAFVFLGPEPVGLQPTPSPSASVTPPASVTPSAGVEASPSPSPSSSSPAASPAVSAAPSASDGTSALTLGLPGPEDDPPVAVIRP